LAHGSDGPAFVVAVAAERVMANKSDVLHRQRGRMLNYARVLARSGEHSDHRLGKRMGSKGRISALSHFQLSAAVRSGLLFDGAHQRDCPINGRFWGSLAYARACAR
jgi:hypothetical protein